MLKLFKLSHDGNREVKVHEESGNDGIMIYDTKPSQVDDNAIYVCEAFHGNVRIRKQSRYKFMSKYIQYHLIYPI